MTPDLAQQIAHFEDRLRHDPGSRAFLPLADLYRRHGRLEEARALLETGLEQHPSFVSAQVALGNVAAELGDRGAAVAVMKAVLATDRDNLEALRVLLSDRLGHDDFPGAQELAERLVRLVPDDRQARAALAALALVEPSSGSSTRQPGATPADGNDPALRESGRAASGITGLETPTLAELYLHQGHLEKARLICERILDVEPDRVDARRVLDLVVAKESATGAGSPAQAGPASGRGRDEPELARFRAWLDAAAEDGGAVS